MLARSFAPFVLVLVLALTATARAHADCTLTLQRSMIRAMQWLSNTTHVGSGARFALPMSEASRA